MQIIGETIKRLIKNAFNVEYNILTKDASIAKESQKRKPDQHRALAIEKYKMLDLISP